VLKYTLAKTEGGRGRHTQAILKVLWYMNELSWVAGYTRWKEMVVGGGVDGLIT